MSNLSQNQARAALHALFEPRPAFVQAAEEPVLELPTNLDEAIQADVALTWDIEAYRWYSAVDAQGVRRVFRFQRGKTVSEWHDLLRKQRLASVSGPFRTQARAVAPEATA